MSNHSSVSIRPGTPSDLAAVQALNQGLFHYEHDQGFYNEDSYNLDWPYEEAGTKYFQGCLSDSAATTVIVAEAGGRLVGYLAASFATKAYRNQNPIAELDNMFVEESHRHLGVGSQLVAAFKDWALSHQVARIRVGAFAANHPALAFYRRHGFVDSELHLEQPLT